MGYPGATAVLTETKPTPPFRRGGGPSRGGMSDLSRAASADDQRAWIKAVADNRDRGAFARLFDHFGPRVKAYLMRSGCDGDTAEEVVQEAMLMVWRRAETFDPAQASVATWVFTIARNKRIDGLRRTRRPELDPNDPALVPAQETAADDVVAMGRLRKEVGELV